MLLNLLKATPEVGRKASLGEAALYALIGFVVVFIGISLLILVVWLVGKIMNKTTLQKQPKVVETKEKPILSETISNDLDEETVAVIMATLMAYYQTNNPKCEFMVKRIKRI